MQPRPLSLFFPHRETRKLPRAKHANKIGTGNEARDSESGVGIELHMPFFIFPVHSAQQGHRQLDLEFLNFV